MVGQADAALQGGARPARIGPQEPGVDPGDREHGDQPGPSTRSPARGSAWTGAEKELASTLEQRDVAIASAELAVENAQVALENAPIAHESAVAQAATSNTEAQIQVESALNDAAAAKANQAATEEVGQQAGNADQVSVANARQALQDAERKSRPRSGRPSESWSCSGASATRPGVSARSAQQERQEACANGNGNTTACNAAKRAENEARASLRTAEAQLDQAEATARQTMIQAASAVTNAQSSRPDRRGQHQHRHRERPPVQHVLARLGQIRRGRPQDRDGRRHLHEDPEHGERRPGQDLGRLGRGIGAHGHEDA